MQKIIESPQIMHKLVELRHEILLLEELNKFLEMKVQEMTQIDDAPSSWIKIEDHNVIMTIISSYADPYKKQILEIVREKPLTILEIIQRTNLPQTSAYRKIRELIENNLIKNTGLVLNNDHKRVHTYSPTIKNMRIYLEENDTLMFLMLENNPHSTHQKQLVSIYSDSQKLKIVD